MKIGFFDSGIGGLLILNAVLETMPEYDYVYFGDTANLPYGDKSESTIYELTKKGVTRLFDEDVAIVIVACNTASAETLRNLQDNFLPKEYPDRKILGVIIPTIEELIESNTEKALLIGTRRTIESSKYKVELVKNMAGYVKLHAVATPNLVPLIEMEKIEEALNETIALVDKTIAEVGEFEALILGCTHYVRLKDGLRRMFSDLRVISQDEIIPKRLKKYIKKHTEIADKLTKNKTQKIILTKSREDYKNYLNKEFEPVLVVEE